MSVLSSQQAEQQYIDSMLGQPSANVEDNQILCAQATAPAMVSESSAGATETASLMTTDAAVSGDAAEGETADDVSLDNLYQLIAVAGLKLAAPVTAIHRVEPGSLSCIDGDRLRTMDGDYAVVDIARFIDNNRRTEVVEHYLLIAAHGYAIACGELLGMETIEPAAMCRRSEISNRIWLAGTVGSKHIAVLDLDGIAQLLQKQ